MNTKQRFKLGAGAGLVTMLLGALLVLAPGAVGAAQQEPVPIDANTCPEGGYEPGTEKIDVNDPPSVFVTAPEGYLIDGYCVKAGSIHNGFGPVWIGFDPPVESATISYPGKDSISHYAVSYVPRGGRLSVAKAVTGSGAPGTETEFEFTVSCDDIDLNGAADGTDAVFTLTAGEAAWVSPYIPDGTECTVTESDDRGATTTTYSPLDGEVTIVAGQTVPVLVTNDFEATQPRTGGISVDKNVTGANAPAAGTEFDFTVDCTYDGSAVDLNGEAADEQAAFSLSASDEPWTFGGLVEGTECTVVETDAKGATTTTYSVAGGEVTIVGGQTTPVVVTNNFPGQTASFTYGIDVDKVNDADNDEEFTDSETAPAEGADVNFEITIRSTGSGAVTLSTLTDTFDGEVVNLLTQVDLSCTRAGSPVTLAVGSSLPAGSTTVCTFTLADYAPAPGTSLENVVEVDTPQTPPASDASTVAVAEVLPAVTGTVTLVKEVTGDTVADWAFDFGGALGEVTLTEEVDSVGPVPVDAGDYTIAEDISDLPDGWELAGVACVDQDDEVVGEAGADGSVDFTVAPDADVTCTFVNEYTAPTVLPAVVTPPKTEAVLGAQTVRTLPRTGDETSGLAGAGAFMVALGAALVLASRRQYANR